MALKGGINKHSEFGRWLKRKKPNTLEKFYDKAEEYMSLEDDPIYSVGKTKTNVVLEKKEASTKTAQINSGGGAKKRKR